MSILVRFSSILLETRCLPSPISSTRFSKLTFVADGGDDVLDGGEDVVDGGDDFVDGGEGVVDDGVGTSGTRY